MAEKKEMTVAEAGKKGGSTTKARYGREHYVQAGKKGGDTTKARHGMDFYQRIGKKSGKSAAKRAK